MAQVVIHSIKYDDGHTSVEVVYGPFAYAMAGIWMQEFIKTLPEDGKSYYHLVCVAELSEPDDRHMGMVHGFEKYESNGCTRMGHGVRLTARCTEQPYALGMFFQRDRVYWTRGGNTYALAKGSSDFPIPNHMLWHGDVALFSINGIGEIRWDVPPNDHNHYEEGDREAIMAFGLLKRAK